MNPLLSAERLALLDPGAYDFIIVVKSRDLYGVVYDLLFHDRPGRGSGEGDPDNPEYDLDNDRGVTVHDFLFDCLDLLIHLP